MSYTLSYANDMPEFQSGGRDNSKAGGHLLRTYSNSFNVHSTTYVATKN